MKSATISYKTFDHLDEVSPTVHQQLSRLTNRGSGSYMRPLLQLHRKGYVRTKGKQLWFDLEEYGTDRSLIIAYHKHRPVGWAVTDTAGMFNVYVARKYRGLGIAQRLTRLWASRNVHRLQSYRRKGHNPGFWVVYTEDAHQLMRDAVRELGLMKSSYKPTIRHVLPTG
jgi:GNAT superfamily N-acetyltransferase